MKIELFEEFSVLARTLNYHTASKALFITQPTLTKHIKDLERELGTQLLVRDSKGVALTESGREVAQKTAFLLNLYHDILSTARKGAQGRLQVAVPLRYSAFSDLAAASREALLDACPGIKCSIRDFELEEEPSELLEKGCDLVLNVYLPEYETGGVKAHTLCRSRLSAWVSRTGRLSGRERVSVSDLDGMVFRPASDREGYPWLEYVRRTFGEHGASFAVGDVLDAQFWLGPVDFGLVFGGSPTAMLGVNAEQIPLVEHIPAAVAAYCRAGCEVPELRSFIGILKREAPLRFPSE